jgi:hypothetical protein
MVVTMAVGGIAVGTEVTAEVGTVVGMAVGIGTVWDTVN